MYICFAFFIVGRSLRLGHLIASLQVEKVGGKIGGSPDLEAHVTGKHLTVKLTRPRCLSKSRTYHGRPRQTCWERLYEVFFFSAHQCSSHFCFRPALTARAGVRNNSIFTVQMIMVRMDVTQQDVTTVNLANAKCRWSHKMYFCPRRCTVIRWGATILTTLQSSQS